MKITTILFLSWIFFAVIKATKVDEQSQEISSNLNNGLYIVEDVASCTNPQLIQSEGIYDFVNGLYKK